MFIYVYVCDILYIYIYTYIYIRRRTEILCVEVKQEQLIRLKLKDYFEEIVTVFRLYDHVNLSELFNLYSP